MELVVVDEDIMKKLDCNCEEVVNELRIRGN